MATLHAHPTQFVSEQEYLSTSYEPDCDYIDGHLEERNLGEFDHGMMQGFLFSLFMRNRSAWGVIAVPECRVQVRKKNYRIPDVTVIRAGEPREQILTHPPLLVVEVMSPEDRLNRVARRNQDYVSFGIEHIWVVDPKRNKTYIQTGPTLTEIPSGILTIPNTPVQIVLADLLAELNAI